MYEYRYAIRGTTSVVLVHDKLHVPGIEYTTSTTFTPYGKQKRILMVLLTVLGRADLKTTQGTADLITAHLFLARFSRPSRLPASPADLGIGGDSLAHSVR